ncbi:quinohemoprotein amine dehydrogenase subunit alpha [Komagataeibacter swingsii]|nr:quinohemoprotein amine dehydrogenase subunit alpha [Komagataeibacter swingsii]
MILLTCLCATSITAAHAQDKAGVGKDPADWVETETGIPVTDLLTTQKCGACHTPDGKGNLSRISWTRTTPEGWSQTIKRMVKLNGLSITPDDARAIVKYLSTYHGLAPEEAKPVMYFAEHRAVDETIIPNNTMRQTCASCHAFAQPMSSRRSHREWALVENLHKAMYSTAQRIYETPIKDHANEEGEAEPDNVPKPVLQGQAALDWLSKNAPVNTAEWAAWRPRIRPPDLGGKWLVAGSMSGHGRFVGEMTITPKAPGSDEFMTTTTLRALDDNHTYTRTGVALVYAGYSWRGTSQGQGATQPGHPDDPTGMMREAMWFAPDQTAGQGRWYWGDYHEFGLDVTLARETKAPVLVMASPDALRTGTQEKELHLYGADLPTDLQPRDIDFGGGVSVRRIVSASPTEVVAVVDVARDAVAGMRDVSVRGAVLQKAVPVYSGIDYIKVSPETGLARLGGIKYGKGYQQFSAIGWSNGPDGKPDTSDDFPVHVVDADWSLAEMPTVTYDDDIRFVGKLDPATGFFTPNVEGPDPQRRFMRNNYGEVWVVANSKTEKDAQGKPLTARAYLVTTVPTYKRWDQPEVSK